MRLVDLAARPHLPRRTVRLRLTLLYGGLFLVSGAALLAITYALVVHATAGFIFTNELGNAAVTTQPYGGKSVNGEVQVAGGGPLAGLTTAQQMAQARQLRAQATHQHSAELHQLLTQSGMALLGMTVISIGLGAFVAGRVLRPLRTITTAAREISATNLEKRLALAGPDDEIKELGDTFDGLLARLEASFRAQRQFVANASHELRTPLARQRTLTQVALADPDATLASLREAHERVLASGRQQERLIEALLTLTRGQAGPERRQPLSLAVMTEEVLLARTGEAARRGIEVVPRLATAPAFGDPRLVERLVANLVDNALGHNVANGRVEVETRTEDGQAVLSVTNTGPVVPAAELDRLREPFQRLHTGRTSHGDGLGLGLSIVHAIATAHDATIETRARPGGGLTVRVSFPAAGMAPVGPPAAAAVVR